MFTKGKKALIAISVASALGVVTGGAYANEKLIDKLYEKGVISDTEYKEIRAEKADVDPNTLKGKWKGGFKWESADKKNKFQVAGRVQMDYYDYDHENEESEYSIRRVYLGVKATIDEIWGVEATYNPDASNLEYGYVDYKPSKKFITRFGQQKFYAGFEEGTSSRFVDFLERSVADGLHPGKQIGIQVFGEPVKKTFFYALGHYNGEGSNAGEVDANNDGKDTMLAVAYNAAGALGSKDMVAHVGYATAQGSRDGGEIFEIDGEARGDTFGTWTTTATSFTRDYTNAVLVVAKGPFKFMTERTTVEVDADASSGEVEATQVSLMWRLTGEPYSKTYDMKGMKGVKPNQPFTSKGGLGSWEIGIRKSEWDAQQADLDQPLLAYEGSNLVKSTTYGVTWVPTEKVRFKANLVDTDYGDTLVGGETEEQAVIFRAQVDF
ncbi:MAG: porin [Proteobacteria bacterium]|nr:porin [Pseudomonadota bacterium]